MSSFHRLHKTTTSFLQAALLPMSSILTGFLQEDNGHAFCSSQSCTSASPHIKAWRFSAPFEPASHLDREIWTATSVVCRTPQIDSTLRHPLQLRLECRRRFAKSPALLGAMRLREGEARFGPVLRESETEHVLVAELVEHLLTHRQIRLKYLSVAHVLAMAHPELGFNRVPVCVAAFAKQTRRCRRAACRLGPSRDQDDQAVCPLASRPCCRSSCLGSSRPCLSSCASRCCSLS